MATRTENREQSTKPNGGERGRHRWWSRHHNVGIGQATVEFAIVSVAFLLIIFGTIDFGRAIYLNAQLENAVRESARELKTRPASRQPANNCGAITQAAAQYRIRNIKNPEDGGSAAGGCGVGEHPRPGLQTATATISCDDGNKCTTPGALLTVTGSLNFQAVTQDFLGLSPITLKSSATVMLE